MSKLYLKLFLTWITIIVYYLLKTPYQKTEIVDQENEAWIQQKLNDLIHGKKQNFGDSLLMEATKSTRDSFLKNKPILKSGAFCFICVMGRPNDDEIFGKFE